MLFRTVRIVANRADVRRWVIESRRILVILQNGSSMHRKVMRLFAMNSTLSLAESSKVITSETDTLGQRKVRPVRNDSDRTSQRLPSAAFRPTQ